MAVIQVSGLSFSYGLDFCLKDVSLEVERGEVVALLGPNGSGKTTLLKCINALLPVKAGKIRIDGIDVSTAGRADLARLVGYVPQSHDPPFPYTVFDVVVMGRTSHLGIFQQPSGSDYALAENALGVVGLSAFRDRPYTQISGGERQLALIARALVQEPKVLLLDEPTAHLDFRNQLAVLKMVRRISAEKGIGVVMSLHDPNHALLFADTIALMSGGRIVSFGSAGEVVTEENIESVYGVEVESISHNRVRLIVPAGGELRESDTG